MPTSSSSMATEETDYILTDKDGSRRVFKGLGVFSSGNGLNFVSRTAAEAYLILPVSDKPLLRLTLNITSTPGGTYLLTDADTGESLHTFKTTSSSYSPQEPEQAGRRYKITLQRGSSLTQGAVSSMGLTLDASAPLPRVSTPWITLGGTRIDDMDILPSGSELQIGCDTEGAVLDYSLSRDGVVTRDVSDAEAPVSLRIDQNGEYVLSVSAHKEGMGDSEQIELHFTVPAEAKADPEIGYGQAEIAAALDNYADFHAPQLLNPHEVGPISYASSAPEVATVDSEGEITLHSAGTTTVTAKFGGDDTYGPGTASFELTVYSHTATAPEMLINGRSVTDSPGTPFAPGAHLSFRSDDADARISYSISLGTEPYAAGVYDGIPLTLAESGEYSVTATNTDPEGMPCGSRAWSLAIADWVDAYAGSIRFDFTTDDYGMTRFDSWNSAFNPETTEIHSPGTPAVTLTLTDLPSPYSETLPSRNRLWYEDSWRFYTGAYSLRIAMPAHTEITAIDFGGSLFTESQENVRVTAGGYASGQWTGNAGEVTLAMELPFGNPRPGYLYANIDGITVSYTVQEVAAPAAMCRDTGPVGDNQVAPRGDIYFTLPEDAALYICFEPLTTPSGAPASGEDTQTIEIDGRTYICYPGTLYQATAKGTLHYTAVRYGRPSEVRTLYIDTLTGLPATEDGSVGRPPRHYDLQGRPLRAPVPGQPYISTAARTPRLRR